MRKSAALLALLIVLLFFGGSFPQYKYNPEVERLFNKALQNYKNQNYELARVELENLITIFPQNHRITACLLLLGKTQYKLKEYEGAIATLTKLLTRFPQSAYVDDGHYQLASCYYRQGRYKNCVAELLWLLEHKVDERLREKAEALASRIIPLKLPQEEIEEFQEGIKAESALWVLTYALAKRELKLGNNNKAASLLKGFINRFPRGTHRGEAEELLEKARALKVSRINIGVILPLSGYYSEEAKGLLDGIRYALKEYNAGATEKVGILVRDSEGSSVRAVEIAKEMAEDEDVLAILGEIESDKTAAIAAIADCKKIPLISPTATEDGIASLSKYVFQVNNDLEIRAKKIATYAVKELRLKTLAILAPADTYGKEMAESFTSTVEELGGEVLLQTWYYEGTKEFDRQFGEIRKHGLRRMLLDSLGISEGSLSLSQMDSLWNALRIQKNMRSKGQGSEVDTAAFPVTSIDGVFFPVYTDDIQYIAPQFALYNIKAQVLGGDYWNDPEILISNQSYINGVIFTSDFFIQRNDPSFRRFRDGFRREMGRTPEKMEVFGYDTMNLVLQMIKRGATSREGIRKALAKMGVFNGIRGEIAFRERPRVNSAVNILQFRDGRIFKVK